MRLSREQINSRYMAYSLRERMLLAAVILVAIVVSWYLLIGNPLLQAENKMQKQLIAGSTTTQAMQKQLQAVRHKLQSNPERLLNVRMAGLNQALTNVDKQLRHKLHGLIPPRQMAKVLESVLQKHHELRLLKVQSLAAVPLVQGGTTTDKSKSQKPVRHKNEIFRHGLRLEFEGSYLATLSYLQSLQSLPWGFYWDEVRLKVEKYPKAKVTIIVHTLSLREGWIGV